MSKIIQFTQKVRMRVDRVEKALARSEKRVLFRLGSYLRTTMQRSMRYGKKPSKPGKPPHARKKNALLRTLIAFVVDLARGTVVCGPPLIGRQRAIGRARSSTTLPELLDQGGTYRFEKRGPGGVGFRSIRAKMAPRPFVAPTFTLGLERFRELVHKEKL